jgi:hypothetical protein
MDALLAGALGGMLLGLISVAHLSLLLVFNPPKALLQKAGEEGIGGAAMLVSLAISFSWAFVGIGAAFLFGGIESVAPTSVPTIPSVTYLVVVLVLAALFAMPAAVVLRDRLRHLALQLLLFIGIFGWLIPNLVMAQRG